MRPTLSRRPATPTTRLRRAWAGALPGALGLLSPERVAMVRLGVGAVMLARPTAVPVLLGTDPATAARTAWLVRMLGAREVAVGGGALRGLSNRDRRTWLTAGLVCDATDALALTAGLVSGALGGGRRTPLVAASAGGALLAVVAQGRELAGR